MRHVERALPALGQGGAGGGDDDGLASWHGRPCCVKRGVRMRTASAAGGRSGPCRPAGRRQCARRCHAAGQVLGLEADRHEAVALRRRWRRSGARRIAASISPGATMLSGKTSRTVRSISRNGSACRRRRFEARRLERPDGGCTSMRSSAITRLTCACDAGRGVARQDAEVDDGLGAAGQHVLLVAGVEDRHRGGGAHHRAWWRRPCRACAPRAGAEQPQVGQRQHAGRRAVRVRRRRTSRRRALDATRHRVLVQLRQRGAEHADGAAAPRPAASTNGRAARGGELQRDRALLGQADQRQRLRSRRAARLR